MLRSRVLNCRASGLLEQCDAPKSRIGRFLRVGFFGRDVGDRGRSSFQGCLMWSTVAAYWFLFFGSIGALERAHIARVAEAANGIQVGATEDDVLRTLGKPLDAYERYEGSIFGIGAHPPQWLYGTTINIKKLIISDIYVTEIPLPINIRLFSYDDDDLVVDWDSNGRVSSIAIPNIPVDHRADKILDTIYDWHRIYLAISSRIR